MALDSRQLSDVELIAVGAFSPLEGFMGRRDYESILVHERLASGLPWTIPVTLAVTQDQVKQIGRAEEVALTDSQSQVVATLELQEVFQYDREREAR
ncbi:MAG: sulfate adenylyltransferase, partial [Acidobacteria bacterium]